MAQVLVRNLDERVVDRLKARAERNKRSLEAELRVVLEEAAEPPAQDLLAITAAIRAMTLMPMTTDSATLIREDRDSR